MSNDSYHVMPTPHVYQVDPPKMKFSFPGFLRGTVGSLVAPGGSSKTTWAMAAAHQLAGGPDLLGLGDTGEPGQVMYLAAEDPPDPLHEKMWNIGRFLDSRARDVMGENLTVVSCEGADVDIMRDGPFFESLCEVLKGWKLLILDTLTCFHYLEENSASDMARVVKRLKRIAAGTGCSVLFLHHTNKTAALSGRVDEQQASRGSSVLTDNIRWQAFLEVMSKENAEKYSIGEARRKFFVRWGLSKQNYGTPVSDRWYEKADGGILKPVKLRKAGSAGSFCQKNGGEKHNEATY